MAITRCPYCHAIIDENDKYCNNCGTQLLFPEDDEVDEEIPGEKILDADVEDKDYTIDEPADVKKATGVIDLDEDLVDELEEKTDELGLDKLLEEDAEEDDVTEEVILVDEIEAAGAGGESGPEEAKGKEGTAELEGKEEEEDDEEEDEEDKEEEEDEEDDDDEGEDEEEIEEGSGDEEEEEEAEGGKEPGEEAEEETREIAAAPAEGGSPLVETDELPPSAKAAESVPPPVTFDTEELDGIGRTVELSKDKIEKFLEVLAEKRAEPAPQPKTVREPSGTLPPWAGAMKGAPVFPDEEEFAEAGEDAVDEGTKPVEDEETEIFPRRRDSDSTIGLPERVGQSPLPFEPAEAEEEEPPSPPPPSPRPEREAPRPVREPERRPFEAVEEAVAAAEPAGPQPPFSFSVFFKSKAFDVLFVGLFWLVALWLAAHSLGTTLFAVLGSMSGPMLLLYAVFVFIYFFLFKFFLGETLGDRLFRERDEH